MINAAKLIRQSNIKFKGAETLYLKGPTVYGNVNPEGKNAGELLCLSVELAIKALSMSRGGNPPKGHDLTELLDGMPGDIPPQHKQLVEELDGLYTLLRYDPDFEGIPDLGDKMSEGREFIKYVESRV